MDVSSPANAISTVTESSISTEIYITTTNKDLSDVVETGTVSLVTHTQSLVTHFTSAKQVENVSLFTSPMEANWTRTISSHELLITNKSISTNNFTTDNVTIAVVTSSYSMNSWAFWLIVLVVSCLVVLTAGGNVLVIISFIINHRLRNVSNYFLLSLAVSDILIGVISMPFYTLYLLNGYWPLGTVICDLWLSMDYTVSNASVANLLIICFDRYFSVMQPLSYVAKRTPRRAAIMISCAWVISFLLWTPWIFLWPVFEGVRKVPKTECYIAFLGTANLATDRIITSVTSVAAFYLPITIMSLLYARIFMVTIKRQETLRDLRASRLTNKDKDSHARQENKAAKTLSAILLAFILTWSPYMAFTMTNAFRPDTITGNLYNAGYWLCYINSTVNPFLYALCNRQFRVTFNRILTRGRNNKSRTRSGYDISSSNTKVT